MKFSPVNPTQNTTQNLKFSQPTPPKSKFESWYEHFCAQPHQGLFANGILLMIAFSVLIAGKFAGWLEYGADITRYHAYAFVFVVFIQFFLGFLFVVFPRFLVQAAIASRVYMRQFWCYFAVSWGFFVSILADFFNLTYIFMCLNFALQISSFVLLFNIHRRSLLQDKYDTKWILIGLFSGLLAHGAFLCSLVLFWFGIYFVKFSIDAGFWLFLFVVVFGVTQRMIPFFTSVKVQGYTINKSKFLMEKIYALLVLKVVGAQWFLPLEVVADALALVLFVYEIYRWKLPFRGQNSILWVLYLSLFWIPVGFLFSLLNGLNELLEFGVFFEKSALHAVALGYFFTILVGFGTRVTLGHSGRTPHADALATWIFVFTQVVVLARLMASFGINFSFDYINLVVFSAVLLVLALGIWSVRYLPTLIKGFKP